MDSWINGRQQLLEQLSKVCDQIGDNLLAELTNEKFVKIDKEQLRLLEEDSTSIKTTAEHNARLIAELERCKAVAERVGELEKENKRLMSELQHRLKFRGENLVTPKARIITKETSKSTPSPSNPPSSLNPIESNETKPVPLEKYQALALKYNRLYEYHKDMKEAKEIIEGKFQAYVDKSKDRHKEWDEWDKSYAKKDAKIKKLEAEVLRLRNQSHEEPLALDTDISAKQSPAALLSTKQFSDEIPRVEILQSSPLLKDVDTPVAVLEPEDEDFEAEPGVVAEEGPHDVDLPGHRSNINQVEDTQFVPLEEHHTSSTDGDTEPTLPQRILDQETPDLLTYRSPSPDTPIVISSRSVKKRKTRHDQTEATPVPKVKFESISSSPIGLVNFLSVNESLDLDDIGEKVDTPRKHRRQQQELSGQASHGPASDANISQIQVRNNILNSKVSNISSKTTSIRHTDSVLQPRSTNERILPRTSEGGTPKKRRIAKNKDVDTLLEDGELASPARGIRDSNNGDRLINLLTKPSPPRRPLTPARHPIGNQLPELFHRPTATSGLAREVTRLAPQTSHIGKVEDVSTKATSRDSGDVDGRYIGSSRPSSKGSVAGLFEYSRPSSRDTARTSVELPRTVSKESKGTSLEPQHSPKTSLKKAAESLIRASDTASRSAPPLSPTSGILPPRRDLQAMFTPKLKQLKVLNPLLNSSKNDSASAKKPRWAKPDSTTLADWEMDPEQEPLRVRPLGRLRLQDFKVNPKYNQGYDYAYHEVVRGNARHSLTGCTKPECCGNKFRALAEVNTAKSPTASQEERDDELLRDFMGDNYYRLQNMSRRDKHELLLQARTREMSNQHGKHRHAYTRPASPPGFWRTDFPTTQEERADQERSKEHDRELVAERYNEAMRPGGRYIFRDE